MPNERYRQANPFQVLLEGKNKTLVKILEGRQHRTTLQVKYWEVTTPASPAALTPCVSYLDDVVVGAALVRFVVLGVLEQDAVHVGTGVLEQLVGAGEEDQRDLDVAQHAQLVRFLHQTELALRKRHLQPTNLTYSLRLTVLPFLSEHRATRFLHRWRLSLLDPLHVTPMLCRSSANVVDLLIQLPSSRSEDCNVQPGHLVPHFLAVHLLPCGHSWSSIFRSCILTHPTPSYFSCTLLTDHCGDVYVFFVSTKWSPV